MNMKLTAVQMIGTQRSGSNLLRLMLNQLPQVSAPHPPHILERFMPLLPLYGDLSMLYNFRRLVEDVCALIACNPVAWTDVELNVNEILALCKEHTLVDITRVIYEEKARSKEANIWMCKSMSNIHYADVLENSLQPLYIFLYRDGRDVACSFKKAVVGDKHIYCIARQWKEEQDKCIALQKRVNKERFIAVCYEDLIHHPENELLRICAFLGVPYRSDCLQYHHSREARNTASSGAMWQHVKEEVMADNCNKYRKELSADEIHLFERIAGSSLLKLGYTLDFPYSLQRTVSKQEKEAYTLQNQQLKREAARRQTPEDAAKRKQQDALLHRLKTEMENSILNEETFAGKEVA